MKNLNELLKEIIRWEAEFLFWFSLLAYPLFFLQFLKGIIF